MTREAKAQEYKLKLDQLRLQYRQYDQQARMFRIQMQGAQTQERIRVMQWNASAYYAPPVSRTGLRWPVITH
jgi:methyl coenzyme M reductase gamma subunit